MSGPIERRPGRVIARDATRAVLGDAAIRLIRRNGVLAPVTLQDIADEAKVSRSLIHHHFGSRQALLRSALNERCHEFADQARGRRWRGPMERWLWNFRLVVRDPSYANLLALLAIDGDDEFDPLPWIERCVAKTHEWIEAGRLRPAVDAEVGTALSTACMCGWAIFRDSYARRLGITVEELDARVEPIIEKMFAAILTQDEVATRGAT